MRSTLLTRTRRACPLCRQYGFALTGTDFFGRPTFQCNACRYEWAAERGPKKGTAPHRSKSDFDDD